MVKYFLYFPFLACVSYFMLCYLAGRYVAPEVYKNEEYDTKVDVFSFSLIIQEVRF